MSVFNEINSPNYQQAFISYLRRGTPLPLSYKSAKPAPSHYIWRTRRDEKVRPSHAANNGKIFSYQNPPETGHPGEDYNCPCYAEPYIKGESEYMYQNIISAIYDEEPKWEWDDFVWHAYTNGTNVTLSQIGHLRNVINHYAYGVEKEGEYGIFHRINCQIADKARESKNGHFTYFFEGVYDFKSVSFPHGKSSIFGEFSGYTIEINNILRIEGFIYYLFYDRYTDPLDIRQTLDKISDPDKVDESWRRITDVYGKVYEITDNWKTKIEGEVKLNANESIYKKSSK